MKLEDAIARATTNPARVLQAETEIGTLQLGSRADITVLEPLAGDWLFKDALGQPLTAQQRLLPALVVRAGELIFPHRRLIRELVTA